MASATRDTLANAAAAAEHLPAALAADLLDPTREAFTSGPLTQNAPVGL